jgi:hypothetical protein
MHLHAERGELAADVGAEGPGGRSEERSPLMGGLSGGRIGTEQERGRWQKTRCHWHVGTARNSKAELNQDCRLLQI